MSFFDDVYMIVSQIPKGRVATYGQIAKLTGRPRASRAVGYALHANKSPVEIPCHRVINRLGRLADSFAFGGIEVQKGLLMGEGVFVSDDYVVDLEKYLWRP